jgi:hypothetical protein
VALGCRAPALQRRSLVPPKRRIKIHLTTTTKNKQNPKNPCGLQNAFIVIFCFDSTIASEWHHHSHFRKGKQVQEGEEGTQARLALRIAPVSPFPPPLPPPTSSRETAFQAKTSCELCRQTCAPSYPNPTRGPSFPAGLTDPARASTLGWEQMLSVCGSQSNPETSGSPKPTGFCWRCWTRAQAQLRLGVAAPSWSERGMAASQAWRERSETHQVHTSLYQWPCLSPPAGMALGWSRLFSGTSVSQSLAGVPSCPSAADSSAARRDKRERNLHSSSLGYLGAQKTGPGRICGSVVPSGFLLFRHLA